MSKEWKVSRTELYRHPIFKHKWHNAQKMAELSSQIEQVNKKSEYDDLVQKMCRKIMEEVANIIQHNSSWNDLAVQTKYNTSGTNFRFRMKYDGGQYYDPVKNNLKNVHGPYIHKFKKYIRKASIDKNGYVEIVVHFALNDEVDDEEGEQI